MSFWCTLKENPILPHQEQIHADKLGITLRFRDYTIDRLGVMAQKAENASEDNKWMIVQCATFSKSLNPWNINKSVSEIRIRIRFPFESSFWISVSSCKLTILLDIQPANRIVIISEEHALEQIRSCLSFGSPQIIIVTVTNNSKTTCSQ